MTRAGLRLALIAAGAVPAAGLALAALAPTGWFPAALAGHWAGHLAALSLPLWCAAGRRALVGGGLLVLAAAALWPHLRAAHAAEAPRPAAPGRSAATANLLFHQDGQAAAVAAATATAADLLLLIETQPATREALRGDPRWPHQAWENPRRVGGIGLLSRWPMRARATELADAVAIDARVDAPEGSLRVIALHTWSPRDGRRVARNRRQLEELAGLAATEPGPLLVLGDLNATPATPGFAALREAGLQAPAGGGVRTWPAFLGPAGIAIDHILGRRIALGEARAVAIPGSDHRGVIARFALPTDGVDRR